MLIPSFSITNSLFLHIFKLGL